MPKRQMPGPLKAKVDLRNMLRHHVIRRCLDALERAAQRRHDATANGTWQELRELGFFYFSVGRP